MRLKLLREKLESWEDKVNEKKFNQTQWDFQHKLLGILIIYWIARKLRLRKLESKAGWTLFNWTMPYAEERQLEIIIKNQRPLEIIIKNL